MSQPQGQLRLPARLTIGDCELECEVNLLYTTEEEHVHIVGVNVEDIDISDLQELSSEVGLMFDI